VRSAVLEIRDTAGLETCGTRAAHATVYTESTQNSEELEAVA
jgi:hypothetical protein